MPSTINLRRKIKSITNTKQITRAMQMVAASKMRRAQEAVLGTRQYAATGYQILARLQRFIQAEGDTQVKHPLLVARSVKKIALIVISSDKSLAGGYNMNVVKRAMQFLDEHKDQQVDVITIGRKADEAMRRMGVTINTTFVDFPARPTSADLRPVAKLTVDAYLAGEYDQVSVIYTKFYSTLRQVAEELQVVPMVTEASGEQDEQEVEESSYIFEPKPNEVLEYIVPRMVEIQLLQTVLEAFASEHSSRMLAMKSATDNATELIGDLRLTYNGIRQANITREIAEISAGANA